MANTWARVRLPRTWPEQLREASASLRRLLLLEREPFERDPLAALVDTARRLDYGAGRFHGTETAGPGLMDLIDFIDLTDPEDTTGLKDLKDPSNLRDLRGR